MKVDNEIYETKGHGWWADDAAFGFSSLRLCLNPVRYGYFTRIMSQLQLPGKTVLDVGCGGGYLAEAFAGDVFIDRSAGGARHRRPDLCDLARNRAGQGPSRPFQPHSYEQEKPANAFAAIKNRSHWYWIDDRDRLSKGYFTFLMILFSLAETGAAPQAPLITVPVN
jgi:hypothetical protein